MNISERSYKMKKITLILLALCITAMLFSAVACNDDPYDNYEETPRVTEGDGPLDLDTQGGAVTAPPSDDSEDNAYINAAPANDEQGWGELTPRT